MRDRGERGEMERGKAEGERGGDRRERDGMIEGVMGELGWGRESRGGG